eukprot:gene46527-2129_t
MSAHGDAHHLSIAGDVEQGAAVAPVVRGHSVADVRCADPALEPPSTRTSDDVTEECPSPAEAASDDADVTCVTDELLPSPAAPWRSVLHRAFVDNWQLVVWIPVCIVSNVGQTVTLD